jgi:ubiquinone/menaquinone biosynthesis C-methylase UbiE
MIRLAKRRLEKANPQIIKLVRGLAQALPFPEAEFDSVISTFPSDYIFDLNTLSGIHRVLRGDGRFILVPAAWIASRKLLDRAAAWLFRITGETPRNIREVIGKRAVQPLKQAGFNVEVCELEIHASTVMVILATK